MGWKSHVDQVGVGGSFVTAACCLGLPAAVSLMGAIGLGFLINDAILLPLLVVFLGMTLAGLWSGVHSHRRRWPFLLGVASALLLIVFIFAYTLSGIAYAAVGGLVTASAANAVLRRQCAAECKA